MSIQQRQSKAMNILFLYNSSQTRTNTVFEHLLSFHKYSNNDIYFCDRYENFFVEPNLYDCIGIHYCLRFIYNKVSDETVESIANFKGIKFLYIQDEYDLTKKTWAWIKRLGISIVFTCVPTENIHRIYPKSEFPDVTFVSVLTGYVPELLPKIKKYVLPSKRLNTIAYRGRSLDVRYGKLGFDKAEIGVLVKKYCNENNIDCDIAIDEASRIYGDKWCRFIASTKAMLGSESGANVFDWDGDLVKKITDYRLSNPDSSSQEIYNEIVSEHEMDGVMNQISPRVFETIALHTALVLFEGKYSGVIKPNEHYIPLKKDGSNLDEVFAKINDDEFLDKLVDRAYKDIIESGLYSYKNFVRLFDDTLSDYRKANIKKLPAQIGQVIPKFLEKKLFLTRKPLRPQRTVSYSIIRILAKTSVMQFFLKKMSPDIKDQIWELLKKLKLLK